MRIAFLLAFVACIPPGRARAIMPHVRLTGEVAPLVLDGARAWLPLGFTFSTDDVGLPTCRRDWHRASGVRGCQIVIFVVRDPALIERRGTDALSNRDASTVTIDSRVTDRDKLRTAAAHEVGHIILDTAEHTVGGIMGGASRYMHAVDKALACRSIGVCLK